MKDLGVVPPGSTIYIEFDTFGADGQSLTMSGLAVTDVEVYKDGSVTQRSSDAGYTLLDTDGIDFDGVTGIHGLSISLADNTDAGFWAAGSHYRVVIASVTVNTQTVTFTAATFRIGYTAAVLNTTIATLASQTSFTLTAGPAEDDALNGMWALIHDVASAVQKSAVQILDYTGATKTVTLAAGATFTAAATDNISIMGPMPLQPTFTGRQANFAADGDFAGNIDGTLATLTTYTGNTPQTADHTASVAAILEDTGTTLPATLSTIAGYIDTEVGTIVTQTSAASIRTAVGLAAANLDTQLADLPTVAEFEARTLVAANYFDPAADTVANVTTVATLTGHTPQTADHTASIAALVADNPNRPARGVELANLMFMMVDATDLNTPETGITVTATISKDGGAFAACTNAVSEVSGGWYKITLTATEMTADSVAVKFTGTGCAQRNIAFRTQPT